MATEGGMFFPKVSAMDAERSADALAAGISGGRLRPGAVVVSMSTKDCPSAYLRNKRNNRANSNRQPRCSMPSLRVRVKAAKKKRKKGKKIEKIRH